MTTQSEYVLEKNLLRQLENIGYEKVRIDNEDDMLRNLKHQLEVHNDVALTEAEFEGVLYHLNRGDIFERAKTLRDRYVVRRAGQPDIYLRFLNTENWCMNEYQVTHQVEMTGKRRTRYDVTILINGLPLVQIELKRRGLELKEAFNQINRYRRDSYDAGYGLFQYVQIYVISNGVNTKYFANTPKRKAEFEFTFFWTDSENNPYSELAKFAEEFLKPCHISRMITHYMVLTTDKSIKVLRPYQYYAVEGIVRQVNESSENGYIWHTTGSGKTLTSFKASQIIQQMPDVRKVLFVVDRKDLDYQTTREFNAFDKDSVDETSNTNNLVTKLKDANTKLIITTIQKLNNAITQERFKNRIADLASQKVVFIFDECHRSQFGDTHRNIRQFFKNAQMFGFTGTPIFKDNAVKQGGLPRTTESLFGRRLHQYTIVDAIRDQNVLKFSVEYVGRYKQKDSANEIDIEVEDIDTKELLESEDRLEKIVDYILAHHGRKTQERRFTAMLCVSSVPTLIKYFDIFRKKLATVENPPAIATIFSFAANEDTTDPEAGGIPEETTDIPSGSRIDFSSRDKLDEYILEYNERFGTDYSTKDSRSYYGYYRNVSERVRKQDIDILVVVNMFLTGFDSPPLNTLYVDKNLQNHGLIQAFSRTNRLHGTRKTQGNIVCFRNLKSATDDAIRLFSRSDAEGTVLIEPYENHLQRFNQKVAALIHIAPTPQAVDKLETEEDKLAFVLCFRGLIRLRVILKSFGEFKPDDVFLSEQAFQDYTSKYLDIRDQVIKSTHPEKVSILEDVDFELELIHRDDINVTYILRLLKNLPALPPRQQAKRRKQIEDLLSTHPLLRSKRKLIEEFITRNLPNISNDDDIDAVFDAYWSTKQQEALAELCKAENMQPDKVREFIENWQYYGRMPREQQIRDALNYKPRLLEGRIILQRITESIQAFIETFLEGMG